MRPSIHLLFALLGLPGLALAQDADGDGSDASVDCDDNDPFNFPGNPEVCDGQDNDCNGSADFGGGGGALDVWVQDTGSIINNIDFTKGNVLQATADTAVTAFGMYLDIDPAATLTLTIGEGSASNGPFTILATIPLGNVPAGAQVHTAPGLNVPIVSGSYYLFSATWSGGNGGNYYDSSGGTSPTWGTFVSGAWTSSAVPPVSPHTPGSFPSGAYDMEITTGSGDSEIDFDGDGWLGCEECDDLDAAVYPGAAEQCNGLDDDCNGYPDADIAGEVDADGDGSLSCEDCDDNDYTISPNNPERCDGLDNNCDGVADFGGAGGEDDGDGDGFIACEDCDDTDPNTYPFAPELCDGEDNDCNGLPDFGGANTEMDEDGDGSPACEDCDDADQDVFPGATELCDGIDNDCDGADPSAELDDLDGDGKSACAGDCDDSDATVGPGELEVCDGLDNDCNGTVDDSLDCDPADATDDPKLGGGCGCDAAPGPVGSWLLALAIPMLLRRR